MSYRRALPMLTALIFAVACTEGTPPTAPPPETATSLESGGQVRSRSLREFVDAQGTYCWPDGDGGCLLFAPPIQNFAGWSNADNTLFASVDYAGLADRWLASASDGRKSFRTSFHGYVKERALPDGRAIVTVVLKTARALVWVPAGTDFSNTASQFGCRAPEVLSGACRHPVLGRSEITVVFYNTAPGAPLPDLVQLYYFPAPGTGEISTEFRATASGRWQMDVNTNVAARLDVFETDTVDAQGNVNFTNEVLTLTRTGS